MSEDARRVTEAGIRSRHPGLSDAEVRDRLLRILLGDEPPQELPAMSAGDLLRRIIAKLDGAGIPHMIAGSLANTYHGEPRTTQGINIVIDPDRDALALFVSSLDEQSYYCDPTVALDAYARRSQFNLVDMATGWKIDFVIRKLRPFSAKEFERRQATTLFDVAVFVATAEDTIIAKLDWAKGTHSERQLRDVASVVAVTGEQLDRRYIEHWVAELGLDELWQHVLHES